MSSHLVLPFETARHMVGCDDRGATNRDVLREHPFCSPILLPRGQPFSDKLTFNSYNAAAEVTYRYITAATIILCASVTFGALLVALHVLITEKAWYKLCLSVLLGIIIAGFSYPLDIVYSVESLVTNNSMAADIARKLIRFTFPVNIIIAFTSIMLFFASTTLLFKDGSLPEKTIGKKAISMTNRIFTLKRLLLMASGICLSGTLLLNSWTRWPLGFLDTVNGSMEEATDIFKAAVNGLVLYHAFTFFLVLAFGFLPMFMWLRAQNRNLFSGYYDNKDPRIEENRKAFSRLFWIPLPILAPFAVVVLEIVGRVTGWSPEP